MLTPPLSKKLIIGSPMSGWSSIRNSIYYSLSGPIAFAQVGGSETSSKPRDELKKQIDDYEDTATIRSDLDSVEEERDDAKSDVVRLDETRKSRDNLEKELWEMIHALKEGTLKVEDLVEPSLEDDEGNAAGEDGDA